MCTVRIKNVARNCSTLLNILTSIGMIEINSRSYNNFFFFYSTVIVWGMY